MKKYVEEEHTEDKFQIKEEEADNVLILSQDFFCTPDYITPEGQLLPVGLNSDIEESILCPKSPEKPMSVKNKRLWHDTFDSYDLPFDEQVEELAEVVSLSEDEIETQIRLGIDSPKKPSYVSQLAISLRYQSMPPPCIKNPLLKNTSNDEVDHFLYQRSKWEENNSSRSGLSRYTKDFHEIKKIGSGNFSSVFKVMNRIDGCQYAVKICTESKRSGIEVKTLASLGFHDHIVGYHTCWIENFQLYIQMELCDHNLSKTSSSKLYTELEVLHILHQIAKALKFVHEKKIAHLDVKPDNIFVKDGVYKLGDFGCAIGPDKSLSIEEGDARYMAHEILNENYDDLDKADIFSLGATIYELVGDTVSPLSGHLSVNLREGKFPIIHGYTRRFQNLLKAMVDPDPVKRPTAKELVEFRGY